MLRAGAEPGDEQDRDQRRIAADERRKTIAEPGERGPGGEHQRRAEPLAQQAGGNLEARHGAGEHAAQQADRRVAQAELRLPDRQHHVDQVGVAVVQRVRAAGDADRAAFLAARSRVRLDDGAHAAPGRRSTKPDPMNDITSSPFWLVPVLRANTRPQPGRLCEARFSAISDA